MTSYAKNTQVSADKTRMEIETLLIKYGADQFFSGWEGNKARVGFRMHNRFVRFDLPIPKPDDFHDKRGAWKSETKRKELCDQELRRRWRALLLVIKAKLEAVSTGIVPFEKEFLAHIILPDGQTVGQWLEPQIAEVYDSGRPLQLLPGI